MEAVQEAVAEVVYDGFPNGSASGFARTMACPASVVLPQASRSTEFAERGTELHGFVRAVLTGTTAADALEKVSEEWRETASKIDLRKLGGDLTEVRCEAAYAVNPRTLTARFLGLNIGRDYGKHVITPDEIPGSDDIEGMWYERPVIGDMKFGYERVAPASENVQLQIYCAAKAWITGADEVEGRIWYVQPSGAVQPDTHVFDRFALDAFGYEAERTLDEVRSARKVFLAGGVPQVNPGEHCKNCGAIDVCPAQVSLARAMVSEISSIGGDLSDVELRARIESLSIDQAGAAMRKGKQCENLLDRVMKALKARAMNEPLPSGPGKEWHRVAYPRESFSQNKAIAMLRSKGASEGEIAALFNTVQVETVREGNVPGAKKGRKK